MKELLERYAKFCQAVAQVDGLEVTLTPRKVSTEADVAAIEKLLGVTVPDDLRWFWTHEFSNVSIAEGDAVLAADELHDAAGALSAAKIARSIAKDQEAEEPMRGWLLHGIPLHVEEEYCFVDRDGSVRQMVYDGAPFEDPIASSFRELFSGWLDSGCWSYGEDDPELFEAYWAKVAKLLPNAVPPSENVWLQYRTARFDVPEGDEPRVVVFQLGASTPKALSKLADAVCYASAEPNDASEPLSVVPERELPEKQVDAMMDAIDAYLAEHELDEHVDPNDEGRTVGFHPDVTLEQAIQLLTDAGYTVDHHTPD